MDHLERVNIGNNEFVKIPGSSVSLNENGWVYSPNSNQRISEGADFDADDVYTYVNKKTGVKFYTKDSDITNNSYIKVNGGASNWIRVAKTTGWDDQPSSTDSGKWPSNKYYGSGAMKLIGDYIEFDVGGNTPDFNTSYWFVLNSAVAIPENPGEEPIKPKKPTITVEYNELTISTLESVTLPTAPKPKFDTPRPGEEPKEPTAPEAEWHLATVTTANVVRIPKEKNTSKTPHKVVKAGFAPSQKKPERQIKSEVLPQAGSKDDNLLSVLGSMILALAGLFGLTVKRKEKDYD